MVRKYPALIEELFPNVIIISEATTFLKVETVVSFESVVGKCAARTYVLTCFLVNACHIFRSKIVLNTNIDKENTFSFFQETRVFIQIAFVGGRQSNPNGFAT